MKRPSTQKRTWANFWPSSHYLMAEGASVDDQQNNPKHPAVAERGSHCRYLQDLLAQAAFRPDNAVMLRTLFLVAVLFTLAVPRSAPATDCRTARHSSKKAREARAKAKLERIKPLIDAGKYKAARRRLRKLLWITPAPWPRSRPTSCWACWKTDPAVSSVFPARRSVTRMHKLELEFDYLFLSLGPLVIGGFCRQIGFPG
jgi:hypothetical protein